MTLGPDERARRAAEALWSEDGASQWFGMRIQSVSEGAATVSLRVARQHCNGFGICHGGVSFALADSAFAFASNSRNRRAVAQHNTISYLAPARQDDELTAVAREVALAGRTGIYDVRVTSQAGVVIAEFRGVSRMIEGHVFEEKRED